MAATFQQNMVRPACAVNSKKLGTSDIYVNAGPLCSADVFHGLSAGKNKNFSNNLKEVPELLLGEKDPRRYSGQVIGARTPPPPPRIAALDMVLGERTGGR